MSMVKAKGRGWIMVMVIQLPCYNMQQVSQGSLKLQAHHDKIVNSAAQSTKSKFLEDQFDYLTQFKDHCRALQVTLRPNAYPPTHRIAKLIESLRRELLEEVISTRRETALAQLPLCTSFDEKLVQSYEEGVVKMDKRLERMEELVQSQQDKNRARAVEGREATVRFKNPLLKKVGEEFMRRSQAVQELMKKKLLLAARVKALQQQQARNHLISATRHRLTQLGYFNHRNAARYYRSKTLPPRIFNSNIRVADLRPKASAPLGGLQQLYHTQRAIFEEELQQVRCENSRLKCMIDSLKAALQQRDNLALLQNLSKEQGLEVEESKARELLFYMMKNQGTRDRIQSCSYYWATLSPSESPRNKWKSKEDNTEEEHAKKIIERGLLRPKRRAVSAEKRVQQQPPTFTKQKPSIESHKNERVSSSFSKVQLKSNERTNASLESWDRPF